MEQGISYTKIIEKVSMMMDAEVLSDAFQGSMVVAYLTAATKEEALQYLIDYRAAREPPGARAMRGGKA
jgi:hypothetical protein